MFKPLSLFIGLRYTQARRNSKFISFIALISMIGLALGVAVLITVLSVMNGFERELKSRVLGMVPQSVVLSPYFDPNWQQLVNTVEKNPKVASAAPFTELQGMLTANGAVVGSLIYGVDPESEPKVSIVQNYMQQGTLADLNTGEFNIVLGSQLAQQLSVAVGDSVTLVLPEATPSPAGVIPRFKRFNVVGLFNVGAEVDGLYAYITLNDAAKLLRMPEGASGVRMKLTDLFAASEVNQQLQKQLGPQYYFSDWSYSHGSLFSAIKMEKMLVSLLLFFIVIVAAFNIVSSLVMLVTDKKADVAILRTLGATPKMITQIFIVQGTVIGVIGTLAGTVLGVILALGISPTFSFISNALQLNLLDQYFINYLPSELRWTNVVVVVAISFVISFVATIYPAWRAAKIQPAEALRYE